MIGEGVLCNLFSQKRGQTKAIESHDKCLHHMVVVKIRQEYDAYGTGPSTWGNFYWPHRSGQRGSPPLPCSDLYIAGTQVF